MKQQLFAGFATGLMIICVAGSADASLLVDGTVYYDGADRQLIYDSDLNITWLDYSHEVAGWKDQTAWAYNLSLTVGGKTYSDWRLPDTVEGPYHYGISGYTTAGYNITTSEMGYLFYTELCNKGYYGTQYNPPEYDHPENWGLSNKGPFQNLITDGYWSGTAHDGSLDATPQTDAPGAWNFITFYGRQGVFDDSRWMLGMAVMPGRVSPVPAPASMFLLGSGLIGLLSLRRK